MLKFHSGLIVNSVLDKASNGVEQAPDDVREGNSRRSGWQVARAASGSTPIIERAVQSRIRSRFGAESRQ
jgi:hypothetical protein